MCDLFDIATLFNKEISAKEFDSLAKYRDFERKID